MSMMEDPSRGDQRRGVAMQMWIVSLCISVFCCAIFSALVAFYVGGLGKTLNAIDSRLANLEVHGTMPANPVVAPRPPVPAVAVRPIDAPGVAPIPPGGIPVTPPNVPGPHGLIPPGAVPANIGSQPAPAMASPHVVPPSVPAPVTETAPPEVPTPPPAAEVAPPPAPEPEPRSVPEPDRSPAAMGVPEPVTPPDSGTAPSAP